MHQAVASLTKWYDAGSSPPQHCPNDLRIERLDAHTHKRTQLCPILLAGMEEGSCTRDEHCIARAKMRAPLCIALLLLGQTLLRPGTRE